MNWQLSLYISMLVFTCALTGILAFYAWKQPRSPGSRAYAGLALTECLFALAEICSVFSPSMALALFWFRLRYTPGILVSVFWFVFALEYSRLIAGVSKRIWAALLIIPVVTQVILWSNPFHGLWIRQEAGMAQTGWLWLADISMRVPALGFLLHSFYAMLLSLTGVALLLSTAWKMRAGLRGQAILLAGGGLTAVFFFANSLINFLPQISFNPFTPGIGLSVVLIALAVLRFEFLKRAPQELHAPEMRSLTFLLIIFVFCVAGVSASVYSSYMSYEHNFRNQVEKQLTSILELKVSDLQDWRAERLADAQLLQHNPAFAGLVQTYLQNPDDVQTKELLQTWLDNLCVVNHYQRVYMLDVDGVERLASPQARQSVPRHLMADSAAVLASGQAAFLDFHRDEKDGAIYVALLAPIYAQGKLDQPLGVVVIQIDPSLHIYPYLQKWPAPSQTAETLLIRRDGESVVFLNPLRFMPDAALNLRIPLTETDVLAVKAALGQTGIVTGDDYRQVDVIGAVAPVSDSPWFLIARVDTNEVYAPLREHLWQTILFYGAILAVLGAGLWLYWRRQRLQSFQTQVKALEALRASEDRFRSMLEQRVEERTAQLRDAQERLLRQERLAALGQLSGNVAHELRNPLGVISNAIYYLNLTYAQADPHLQEYLAIIDNETHIADKIITDLLDQSRLKAPDRKATKVFDLLEHTLKRFPPPANIGLAIDIRDETLEIWVDRNQIMQVVGNLLTNAYQEMTDGGSLGIAAHQENEYVALSITDSGGGITPENMPHLFDPLFTTKIRGNGLGLAVSQKLTEANGGRITVHSEAGNGATFTVYLQRYVVE